MNVISVKLCQLNGPTCVCCLFAFSIRLYCIIELLPLTFCGAGSLVIWVIKLVIALLSDNTVAMYLAKS